MQAAVADLVRGFSAGCCTRRPVPSSFPETGHPRPVGLVRRKGQATRGCTGPRGGAEAVRVSGEDLYTIRTLMISLIYRLFDFSRYPQLYTQIRIYSEVRVPYGDPPSEHWASLMNIQQPRFTFNSSLRYHDLEPRAIQRAPKKHRVFCAD